MLVLEKEFGLARHQTGHNSGVIHSGIYYEPGSLKADLCRRGARATKDFCREQGIPVTTQGKLLVATDDRDGTWLPVVGGVLPVGAVRQTVLERAPARVEAPPAEPVPAPAWTMTW